MAKSTNCDVTTSAVIGHFPYCCTDDVCETVRMLPGYRDDEGARRSWPTLRTEMLGACRALDNEALKYTHGHLERLCSEYRESEPDCLVELKSFLLAFHHISERTAASGMMCEYERTMMLPPMRM